MRAWLCFAALTCWGADWDPGCFERTRGGYRILAGVTEGCGMRSLGSYADLRLRFEYRLEEWAEALVLLRVPPDGPAWRTGVGVQLAHDFHNRLTPNVTGAVAGKAAPRKLLKPGFGEWRKAEIELRGSRLTVRIEGEVLQEGIEVEGEREGSVMFWNAGHAWEVRGVELEPLGDSARTTLGGWQKTGGGEWRVGEEIEGRDGHGILYGDSDWEDFELAFSFRTGRRVNSGVFLRADPGKYRGFEVQIYSPPWAVYPTGSIYGATRADLEEDTEGRWARMRIRVRGRRVRVWVNGRQVAEGEMPAAAPAKGKIGFQIHSDQGTVRFRDVGMWGSNQVAGSR